MASAVINVTNSNSNSLPNPRIPRWHRSSHANHMRRFPEKPPSFINNNARGGVRRRVAPSYICFELLSQTTQALARHGFPDHGRQSRTLGPPHQLVLLWKTTTALRRRRRGIYLLFAPACSARSGFEKEKCEVPQVVELCLVGIADAKVAGHHSV